MCGLIYCGSVALTLRLRHSLLFVNFEPNIGLVYFKITKKKYKIFTITFAFSTDRPLAISENVLSTFTLRSLNWTTNCTQIVTHIYWLIVVIAIDLHNHLPFIISILWDTN